MVSDWFEPVPVPETVSPPISPQLVVRPEWWQLDDHGPVRATVERVTRLGTATSLWGRVGGHLLALTLAGSAHGALRPGDTITLRLERSVLLDPIDDYRLEL
jgi:hypothetical protein